MKIFDCFMYFDEEAVLELRLNFLNKYVDYKKFQKFEDFVNEKGYQQLINTHFEKGFPESNFIESYRRYAKSLITLNGSEGKDKKTGLLFEFVLDQNPYKELNSKQMSGTFSRIQALIA